jgi:hypothetical protein
MPPLVAVQHGSIIVTILVYYIDAPYVGLIL